MNHSESKFDSTQRPVRDPVCGMQVEDARNAPHIEYGGKRFAFCSEECRMEFEDNPEEYNQSAA